MTKTIYWMMVAIFINTTAMHLHHHLDSDDDCMVEWEQIETDTDAVTWERRCNETYTEHPAEGWYSNSEGGYKWGKKDPAPSRQDEIPEEE